MEVNVVVLILVIASTTTIKADNEFEVALNLVEVCAFVTKYFS